MQNSPALGNLNPPNSGGGASNLGHSQTAYNPSYGNYNPNTNTGYVNNPRQGYSQPLTGILSGRGNAPTQQINQGLNTYGPQVGALMRNVQLPKFTGGKLQFKTWEKKVRMILSATRTHSADWASLTRLALEGLASTLILNRDPTGMWDFETIMQELAEEFETVDPALATMSFVNTRQYDTEPISEFLRRLPAIWIVFRMSHMAAQDMNLICELK